MGENIMDAASQQKLANLVRAGVLREGDKAIVEVAAGAAAAAITAGARVGRLVHILVNDNFAIIVRPEAGIGSLGGGGTAGGGGSVVGGVLGGIGDG